MNHFRFCPRPYIQLYQGSSILRELCVFKGFEMILQFFLIAQDFDQFVTLWISLQKLLGQFDFGNEAERQEETKKETAQPQL